MDDPDFALGHSVGLAAFVWGYPLIETVRTCRLQFDRDVERDAARGPMVDWLRKVKKPATAAHRDVVTPANDLLYTGAWFNLANGPRLLSVPSSAKHGRRYFVHALYDAWTNNFANPGMRESPPDGEIVCLVGPTYEGEALPGTRLIKSPTDLVWLIGRIVTGDDPKDAEAALALQRDITLELPPGTDKRGVPGCVRLWSGPTEDTIAACEARPSDAANIAHNFFRNLATSLIDNPIPAADRGLAAWLASAKLVPGEQFDLASLDQGTREGLVQGLVDGVRLVLARSRSRGAKPWTLSFGLGRYGTNYLVRAVTAYKGLGAVAPEEAVYAMSDFDAARAPLDGRNDYVLRFAPGEMPPVDAFWSVTLYGADRFLHANPMARYSIGDRTAGLKRDADGGLSIRIGIREPADRSNWLPAPAGNFYLALRLYCPREETRTWRIPPATRLA